MFTIFLLSACGGNRKSDAPGDTPKNESSSDITSASNNSDDGSSASTSNSGNGDSATTLDSSGDSKPASVASQGSVVVDYDQIIYDASGMKVTLTGYKHEFATAGVSEGYYWYFTIENNTDKEINTRIVRSSVNGCMYELEQGVIRTQAGETIESGRKIWLRADDLNARGITAIENFEFILWFDEHNGNKWTEYAVSEPITLPAPEPLDPGFKQAFDVGGVVVVDKVGIKATAIRVDYDIISDTHHGIWMFIENNSGIDVEFEAACGMVISSKIIENPKYLDAKLFCKVMDGKVAFGYIEIYKPDFEENGGGKIETAELIFTVGALESDGNGNRQQLIGGIGDKTEATVSFDADGNAR
jgi:hypothetical protein